MAVTDQDRRVDERRVTPVSGVADPGPLGLAAFAMTTFVLSVFNAKLIATGEGVVLGLALFYGGTAQLLAGMWEFKNNNTFGATAFTSYGAFWLSFWYLNVHTNLSTAKGHDATHAVGVFLVAWAFFTAYMLIASLRTTVAIIAVFLTLTITFILLAIGAFADKPGWTQAGGWAGLVTAAVAWYASFAAVTNATFKRTVLPVIPR